MKINKNSNFTTTQVLLIFSFLVIFVTISSSNVQSTVPVVPCETPDTNPTVIIDGCDTGVNNVVVDQNCTISDEILKCAAINAKNHGEFVSCVARLTNDLKKKKIITGKEKGKIQSCAAKADNLVETPNNVFSGDIHHFNFETASDELSVAFQKLYTAYTTTPSQENMIELDNLRNEGKACLVGHESAAAAALIDEAMQLDPFDTQGFTTIFHLLAHFESEAGINFLSDKVTSSQAEDCPYSEEYCFALRGIRFSALEALGRISSMGSTLAREKVLSLVNAPDVSIQRKAIELFYDIGGMSRWRAKREMAKQLPVSKRYLLYEIY